MLRRLCTGLLLAGGFLLGPAALAVDVGETEANDNKPIANLRVLACGDTITGTTTGASTTTPGGASADYFRVRVSGLSPGTIYRHRLTREPTSSAVVGTLRGLTQASGGAGNPGVISPTSDATYQTATGSPAFVQWYGNGDGLDEVYFRVTGTGLTTTPYRWNLTCLAISPLLGPFMAPGSITIKRATGNTSDTDFWVFDGGLNPIPLYGRDDGSPNAEMTRTFAPGLYYLAVSNFNTASNLPNPADDSFFTGSVLDFPKCANSSTTTGVNCSMAFVSAFGTTEVPAGKTGPFDVVWIQFFVADVPGACCFSNGFCIEDLSSTCTVGGGTYQGAGTVCTPNPCPTPCCLPTGECRDLSNAACASAGGIPVPNCPSYALYSAAPGSVIGDNATITSAMTVPDSYPMGDVNVQVVINHTFLGDLNIDLSHNFTTVRLWSKDCGGCDNMIASADDEGPALSCGSPTTGFYSPSSATAGQLLSAFDGQDVGGTWQLTVADTASGDTGILVSWTLGVQAACRSGACCLVNGSCIVTTPAACVARVGIYLGDETLCTPNPCPVPYHDYLTTCGGTFVAIGIPGSIYNQPIPANFFGPGSDPFIGTIQLGGLPLDPIGLGMTDTIIARRNDPVGPLDPPLTAGSAPIEIVALSLVSVNPITVTYNGGTSSLQWNVMVDLSAAPQTPGILNAVKTHANGGTFNASLPVQPRLTFVPVLPGPPPTQFDAGLFGFPPILFQMNSEPFVNLLLPGLDVFTDLTSNWKIGVNETVPGDPSSQVTDSVNATAPPTAGHTVCPPPSKRCIYRITCIEGTDCVNLPVAVNGLIAASTCYNTCSTAIFHRWGDTNCCIHATLVDCAFTTLPIMPITSAPCPCIPRGACCLPGGCAEGMTAADCAAGGGFFYGVGTSCPNCDDGNDCTDDTCDPTTGACVNTPKPLGTPCADDGNDCTDDYCDGNGNCIHPPKPYGSPCADDGNDCTDDICDGNGACTHPPKPYGSPCADDGNDCTDDICDGNGGCIHPPKPYGTPCPDDGNPCTDDICDGFGGCYHPPHPFGTPCGPGGPCYDEVCDGNGNCIILPWPAGTPCGPGGACYDEVCDGFGNCVTRPYPFGTPCPDDGNPCTDDYCDGNGNCIHPPKPAGTLCGPSGPCFDTICDGAGGCITLFRAAGTPCPDDGNPCTDDYCDGNGACIHPPKPFGTPCGPSGPCFDTVCDGTGGCITLFRPFGTPCPDDGNPCTDDICDGAGNCIHPPKPFGTPCGPAGACFATVCDGAGGCIVLASPFGTPCPDDGNPCTNDYCDGFGACIHPPKPAGTPCPSDGNACTLDACDGAGGCQHTPIVCDDGNPCTDDSCNPATGCVYTYACRACCFPNGNCTDLRPAACVVAGGIPLGAGSDCTPNPCPPPDLCLTVLTGDANCDTLLNNFDIDPYVGGALNPFQPTPTPQYLAALGGNPVVAQACWDVRLCWGDTNCDGIFNNFDIDSFVMCIVAPPVPPNGCPCPPQACCFPNQSCLNLRPAACILSGGVPQGPGSNCGIVICP